MTMVTTIQLQENTLIMLKQMKQNASAGSYDELIHKMIQKCQKPEKSLAGFLGKANLVDLMEGLRDKDDDD